MTAPEHLLEVKCVSKAYGKLTAVDQVSLHVDPGEVVALLGRNGAGKTTTFGMVIGRVKPDAGRILLRGDAVTTMPIFRRSRKGMGFLPHGRSVFQRLTVEENLRAVLETRKDLICDRRARAAQMLAEYGLTRVAGRNAGTLSSGEMRRLEICRAMITGPSILLLDEPFAGVDPIQVRELKSLVRRLPSRGASVLFADHTVRESLTLCDRAYVLSEGRMVRGGSPSELLGSN